MKNKNSFTLICDLLLIFRQIKGTYMYVAKGNIYIAKCLERIIMWTRIF